MIEVALTNTYSSFIQYNLVFFYKIIYAVENFGYAIPHSVVTL